MTNPTPHGQVPEALEDFEVRKLAAIGAVRTSSGLVERRPIEYRRELEDQFVRGFRAAEKRLSAISAAPAGWKLVPVEPTADQEWAGKNAALRCSTMGEACKIYKAMLAAAPKAPQQEVPATERQYIYGVKTVADLVNNLLLLDQSLPIYAAQHIQIANRRRTITVPPTVSRERVKDERWIGEGDELNAAAIWTRAEAAPKQEVQEHVTLYPGCSHWGYKGDTAQPAPSGESEDGEHTNAELRQMLDESFEEKKKCYLALGQHQKAISNLIAERDALKNAPSGDAEPQWLPLTPELLTAIESGDHGTRFWIASKWLSEPEIGEYEWRQGRGPHGFNTHDSRLGADEVTHVLPYKTPQMPAARKEGK